MKQLAKLMFVLLTLSLLTMAAYGALCKGADGKPQCGESCQTSGSSCTCEGDCSDAESEAVRGAQ